MELKIDLNLLKWADVTNDFTLNCQICVGVKQNKVEITYLFAHNPFNVYIFEGDSQW